MAFCLHLQQSPPDFCWGFSESIIWFYTCVQPVMSPGEISGRYFLGSPGKGWDGAWLKCPIRKIAMVPSINSSAMTMKHILSITLATRNHSSFSCRARRKDDWNSDVNTSFSGIGRLNPNTNINCSCVNQRHIQLMFGELWNSHSHFESHFGAWHFLQCVYRKTHTAALLVTLKPNWIPDPVRCSLPDHFLRSDHKRANLRPETTLLKMLSSCI